MGIVPSFFDCVSDLFVSFYRFIYRRSYAVFVLFDRGNSAQELVEKSRSGVDVPPPFKMFRVPHLSEIPSSERIIDAILSDESIGCMIVEEHYFCNFRVRMQIID